MEIQELTIEDYAVKIQQETAPIMWRNVGATTTVQSYVANI